MCVLNINAKTNFSSAHGDVGVKTFSCIYEIIHFWLLNPMLIKLRRVHVPIFTLL